MTLAEAPWVVDEEEPHPISRLLNPTAEATVAPDNNDDLFDRAEQRGYFVNDSTLELELFHAGMGTAMLAVMESELGPSQGRRVAFQNWIADPDALDAESLLGWIERIGKGRFAQTLCAFVTLETCPPYIRRALERLRDAVS